VHIDGEGALAQQPGLIGADPAGNDKKSDAGAQDLQSVGIELPEGYRDGR
jgi:hypothetical protein